MRGITYPSLAELKEQEYNQEANDQKAIIVAVLESWLECNSHRIRDMPLVNSNQQIEKAPKKATGSDEDLEKAIRMSIEGETDSSSWSGPHQVFRGYNAANSRPQEEFELSDSDEINQVPYSDEYGADNSTGYDSNDTSEDEGERAMRLTRVYNIPSRSERSVAKSATITGKQATSENNLNKGYRSAAKGTTTDSTQTLRKNHNRKKQSRARHRIKGEGGEQL